MSNRWTINKFGLVNFWYYDEEEFQLSDGKLLLRGANGSGKSVTMQSFIPLLLDGNKRPERLDPFGTTARKIENYLLVHEDENERTAYLYMEFKKKDSETYLTIGMGLKAVRGRSVDSWYFLITDGRRVNKDFYLYINKGYEKTPLTKKELENRIGTGGVYTDSQSKYKEKVNEHLFGYSDIESYEELIDLLINIRTPKLSKDFKPTAMYEILENSLRQLTEEDLRPMSEAMENMDNLKLRIEQLEYSLKSVKNIDEHFSKYNNFMLQDKARRYINEYDKIKTMEKEKRDLEEEVNKLATSQEELKIEIAGLEKDLKTAESKIEEYKNSDIKETKEKLEAIKNEIFILQEEKKEKNKNLEEKRGKLFQKQNQEKEILNDLDVLENEKKKTLIEMDSFSEEFDFKQHEIFKGDYNLSFIKGVLEKHRIKIQNGRKLLFNFEVKKQDFEDALKEKDLCTIEEEEARNKLKEAEEYLTTIKEEYIEKIVKWNESNTELKLEEEKLQFIARSIMQVGEFSQLSDINREIGSILNKKESKIILEIKKIEDSISKYREEIGENKSKIEELKNSKEVDYQRAPEVIQNRKILGEMGIPFIPLYKAIDFNKNLRDEHKLLIEASLVDMGLIDALIIPSKYKDIVLNTDKLGCDKYIFGNPNFLGYSLAEYLKVDESELGDIRLQEVDDALRSIFLDKNSSTYIDEKGNYGLGILKGKASKNYTLKYIGAASRKHHIERLIEELFGNIKELEDLISKEEKALNALNRRLETLTREYKEAPSYEDLKRSLELIHECSRELNGKEKELSKAREKYNRIEGEIAKLKKEIFEITEGLELEKDYKTYEDAEDAANDYNNSLAQFEILESKVSFQEESLKNIREAISGFESDIDEIIYNLNKNNKLLEEKQNKKEAFEEVLKTKGYEEIKEELDRCYDLVNKLPDSIRKKRDGIIRLEESLEHNKKLRVEKENSILREKALLDVLEKIFLEEYELGYVIEISEYKEAYKLCQESMKITQDYTNKSKEAYDNALFESYNKNMGTLRDYQPKVITIFGKDIEEAEHREILQSSERKDLRFRVNGKEVKFKDLKEIITREIEENKLLLSDKEREFFQDILIKNISNKIRAKIYYSETWVNNMNKLMESMNTSSSFKLTLRWVPKKAENEGQLDTRKLVEILQKEEGLIRAEDIEELSKHFTSKVKEIVRAYEDKKENRNYYTVIKEILDYRKWYEFKLYSKKEGEKAKELTNNAFFQLSGGEKAMAMYIPLFTAVYSRYDIADKKDCPRIVSLDEAFAGVDEGNIRDMFRILKEMNLDYILNSQVLWGDYDTVSNLSICEIVRPANADYVTVIRYHWNGKEKLCLI